MIENPKQPETTSENFEDTSQLSEESSSNPSEQPGVPLERELEPIDGEDSTPIEVQASETAEDVSSASSEGAEPSEESIRAYQEEIAALRQQLQEQSQQAEAFKAQYIRNAADFDNFRRRTVKEKETLEQQVKRNTISELLSIVDNFERARTQIKPANDGEMAIHKSYQGVYKSFVDSLKRIGVSAMRPEGQPFDPNYHEAMLREPTNEYPEGTVIEQLVRGYMIGDRVLRHAMVKVAAPAEPSVSEDGADAQENAATTES